MLKLIGAVLLVFAAALLGERAARWERHKLDMLQDVLIGLTVLEAEIDYLASDLAEALRKAATAAPKASGVFAVAAREIERGVGASQAWSGACRKWGKGASISERQLNALCGLSAAFGPWRGEDVVRHLRLAQKLLLDEEAKARGKLDTACRLWRYLGWAGGITLVLVLV